MVLNANVVDEIVKEATDNTKCAEEDGGIIQDRNEFNIIKIISSVSDVLSRRLSISDEDIKDLTKEIIELIFKTPVEFPRDETTVEDGIIDPRFHFNAINFANGNRYTRQDAVIITADDPLIIELLSIYLTNCVSHAVDTFMIENIRRTLNRIMYYRQGYVVAILDGKFTFTAVDQVTKLVYNNMNAMVFCAKDKIFALSLEEMIIRCSETKDPIMWPEITWYSKLLTRVANYQREFGSSLPDIVGEDEFAQCMIK